MKQPNEEESREKVVPGLKEKDWWWRRLVFSQFDETTYSVTKVDSWSQPAWWKHGEELWWQFFCGADFEFNRFRDKLEVATWRYELVRRLLREKQHPAWPDLPQHVASVFVPKLGVDKNPAIHILASTSPNGPPWSKPWAHQWNLTAEDSDLIRSFMGFINSERERLKLPTTHIFPPRSKTGKHRSANKGNKHRNLSWRWPELMDIDFFCHPARLNASERSALSDAKQAAKSFEADFLQAWKDVEALRPMYTLESLTVPGCLHRWLRENFLTWFPLQTKKVRESLPK